MSGGYSFSPLSYSLFYFSNWTIFSCYCFVESTVFRTLKVWSYYFIFLISLSIFFVFSLVQSSFSIRNVLSFFNLVRSFFFLSISSFRSLILFWYLILIILITPSSIIVENSLYLLMHRSRENTSSVDQNTSHVQQPKYAQIKGFHGFNIRPNSPRT